MGFKVPERLTITQGKILALVFLNGGKYRSLNRLANKLGINYSWAWALVQRLETQGHITINRAGRDLIISTAHQADGPNRPQNL